MIEMTTPTEVDVVRKAVEATETRPDAVVAMCKCWNAIDGFMIVTQQGKLYRLSSGGKDLEKLWVEVPV